MEEKTENPYDGVDAFKISGKYAAEVWNEAHAVGKVEGEAKGRKEMGETLKEAVGEEPLWDGEYECVSAYRLFHIINNIVEGKPARDGLDEALREPEGGPMSEIPKKFAKESWLKRAYIEGHAVGKVEGWNDALKRFESLIISEFATGRLTDEETTHINSCLEALRKQEMM